MERRTFDHKSFQARKHKTNAFPKSKYLMHLPGGGWAWCYCDLHSRPIICNSDVQCRAISETNSSFVAKTYRRKCWFSFHDARTRVESKRNEHVPKVKMFDAFGKRCCYWEFTYVLGFTAAVSWCYYYYLQLFISALKANHAVNCHVLKGFAYRSLHVSIVRFCVHGQVPPSVSDSLLHCRIVCAQLSALEGLAYKHQQMRSDKVRHSIMMMMMIMMMTMIIDSRWWSWWW